MHFHFALGNRKNLRPPLNNLGPLGVVDVLTNSEVNDLFLDFSKMVLENMEKYVIRGGRLRFLLCAKNSYGEIDKTRPTPWLSNSVLLFSSC